MSLVRYNRAHIMLFETANGWTGNEVTSARGFTIRGRALGMVENAAHISQNGIIAFPKNLETADHRLKQGRVDLADRTVS